MNNPFGEPIDDEDDDLFCIDQEVLDKAQNKFRVAPGKYPAKLIDAKNETSRAGNPMVTMTFALTGETVSAQGVITDGDPDDGGKEFKVWCALTPAALFKFNEVAKALGCEAVNGRLRAKRADLIGRFVVLEMVDREYEGRMMSSVDKVHPHPNGTDGV